MRAAFKEWAVVVDALDRGEQIVILRKGGISEARGGFEVKHSSFWLFPTLFHQQREAVIPTAQTRYDQIAPTFTNTNRVRISNYAEVAAWFRVDSFDMVKRLAGQHIWREDVLADRFEWGRTRDIYAFAVRVMRLPAVVELPMLPEYGGCKSWVELQADIPTKGASPVLQDAEFNQKLEHFRNALKSAG